MNIVIAFILSVVAITVALFFTLVTAVAWSRVKKEKENKARNALSGKSMKVILEDPELKKLFLQTFSK